jgi:hypothetical protein
VIDEEFKFSRIENQFLLFIDKFLWASDATPPYKGDKGGLIIISHPPSPSKKYVTPSQIHLLPIFFYHSFFTLNPLNSISFLTEISKNV